MPLHGKIVVVKRSGGDGTEFPLTASCLFGRKPDCDIRIQLPQVSKEHCRIELNENKEVILTNLSSVNPTQINGEVLQQSERLKHGDVITIIDRSFRFEYPPAPTPKKSFKAGKAETFKVLQDQHFVDTLATGIGEKRISEVSTDPHLKDGTNYENIQRSLEKTVEVESKEDGGMLQSKTTSPFSDLYQMIKKSLDVKTPQKSTHRKLQAPSSRLSLPKPGSFREDDEKPAISTGDKSTPSMGEAKVFPGTDGIMSQPKNDLTPKSVKRRKSSQVLNVDVAGPVVKEAVQAMEPEAASPQVRQLPSRAAPQKFTVTEVIEQISAQAKSPMRRRSKEASPAKPAMTQEQEQQAEGSTGKVKEMSKKRKSGDLEIDMPRQQTKKKRVSFGGYLAPELFDKKMPPDSPLRKGATPRRSLCLSKPKQSLLRRTSVMGLLKEFEQQLPNAQSPTKTKTSVKTPKPGKIKSRSPSPKAESPGKKSPKPRTPSPKAESPGKKSPKPRTPSPKAESPGKKSPKPRTPSPKAESPGKKSPKPRTPSPKAESPGKKSPKPRTPSPKAESPGKKSPKPRTPSPKAESPGKKSPKPRMPKSPKTSSPLSERSPSRSKVETPMGDDQQKNNRRSSLAKSIPVAQENAANVDVTPAKTPLNSQVLTPTVQGRFSVSRISTPSPVAEDAVTHPVTPKLPLRRQSMKSNSRKTPSMVRSAVKVMHRRSGISRASMKAKESWASIVKFGQTKTQVLAPAKKMVKIKPSKKTVPKPQTPARKVIGHVSTGHADSPATIVVGKALRKKVVHPTGTAPTVVINTALLKRNMKMDEDLTGISEMFKTPVNERKRRSEKTECCTTKTPVGVMDPSVVEQSVLNTPEEPGEMMVSPLSVAATVKRRGYNSEAVKRLLNGDEESSFVCDNAFEMGAEDSSEQQCTELNTASATTPKQKLEQPQCLTGVKRIMKTPKQKAEPVENLRGKLLKTPKQKPEPQECLTGVKRIMKTPKQKAEPVEDLRGKLLKTPKQKPEPQECLTGVKRIMKTPRHKAEPVEDLRGKLLQTPKQKPEQKECLTGVKRIMTTPRQESEPVEDIRRTLLETPKEKPEEQESLAGVKTAFVTPKQECEPKEDTEGELLKTPKDAEVADVTFDDPKEPMELPTQMQESQEPLKITDMMTSNLESPPLAGIMDIKKMTAPKEKTVPVERLMKTPKEKGKPVEENFGIKRLMKSPKLKGSVPVEDFEGLKELMEEPLTEITKAEDQEPEGCALDITQAFAPGQPQDNVPHSESEEGLSDVKDDDPQVEVAKGDANEDVGDQFKLPNEYDGDEASSQAVVQKLPEEQHKNDTAACKVTELDTIATDPVNQRKSVRGRRAKAANAEHEATEQLENPTISAPIRGRRGRQTVTIAPPTARHTTRSRTVKSTDRDIELTQEENASLLPSIVLKPKRGRNAKKMPDQAEVLQEVSTETEMVPKPECEQQPPLDVNPATDDMAAPAEKAVLKPRRGRKPKQDSEQPKPVPELQEPLSPSEDIPHVDLVKEANAKLSHDQLEVAACQNDENKSAVAMETKAENLPEVQKKSVRGRRAKVVEPEATEDKQKAADVQIPSEDAFVPPVRGRRQKKAEAAAPPAVRQTTRSRKTKSEQGTSDPPDMLPEKAMETKLVTEVSSETTYEQMTPDISQEENESPPPAEEAALKPLRGRKIKHTPVELPQSEPEREVVSEQQPVLTIGKQRRGRKTNADTIEQAELAEDSVVSVKTGMQSQPQVRTKRGRNAKHEEETNIPEEPVKKLRRTRKAEHDHEEPNAEIQKPEEAGTPLVSKLGEMIGQATMETKARRSQKARQDTERQEVPTVTPVYKPKRGRKAKPVEEVSVTAEVPSEEKPQPEEKQPSESSQVIPSKRARRGKAASHEETTAEAAPISVEPARKGRHAAAKTVSDDPTMSKDPANLTEGTNNAVVEDTHPSKRSVRWKMDAEVHEIPKATPIKAGRGRRSRVAEQNDTEHNNMSKNVSRPEEKDLSEVVEPQPVKRARRTKLTEEVASTSKVDLKKGVKQPANEAETQPNTRRGRSAKK